MLGLVTSFSGIAMVVGSLLVTVLPKPKDRVRVIYLTMLFSLGIENFLINYVGPTIGTHSGPGTLALFYMGDYR